MLNTFNVKSIFGGLPQLSVWEMPLACAAAWASDFMKCRTHPTVSMPISTARTSNAFELHWQRKPRSAEEACATGPRCTAVGDPYPNSARPRGLCRLW